MLDKLIKFRRDLHQIPELEFDLFKTKEYLLNELNKLEFEITITAKTGILAFKKGTIDETIAFRSDMDGLPIEELNDISFKSDKNMHACGHDSHMAMLLVFANYLNNIKLNKNVLLIFQPAEEGPGGAKEILKDDNFKKYNVKYILGIHVYPELNEGIYGLKEGYLTARNAEFDIYIKGIKSHGALPELGNDSIVIASNIINIIQSIVSRNISPLEKAVITIGKISGGDARNIISGSCILNGTIRSYDLDVYNLIKRRIFEITKGFEIAYNCNINLDIKDFYPPVYNDKYLYELAIKTFDKSKIYQLKPLMIAEDFSFYQEQISGLFIMLGVRNEKLNYINPLHSPYFNLDEKSLINGINFYIEMSKSLNIF